MNTTHKPCNGVTMLNCEICMLEVIRKSSEEQKKVMDRAEKIQKDQEGWREEFKKKVSELKNQNVSKMFPEEKLEQGEGLEFGYRWRNGNTIHTVTDWGNILAFIQTVEMKARREGYKAGWVKKAIDEINT